MKFIHGKRVLLELLGDLLDTKTPQFKLIWDSIPAKLVLNVYNNFYYCEHIPFEYPNIKLISNYFISVITDTPKKKFLYESTPVNPYSSINRIHYRDSYEIRSHFPLTTLGGI